MTFDPGLDFVTEIRAVASSVLALAAAAACSPVQEVLLQAIADAPSKLRARAAQHTVTVVTSVGVVALSITAHNGLALLIPRSALSASTLQSVTTIRAIGVGLVLRTVR